MLCWDRPEGQRVNFLHAGVNGRAAGFVEKAIHDYFWVRGLGGAEPVMGFQGCPYVLPLCRPCSVMRAFVSCDAQEQYGCMVSASCQKWKPDVISFPLMAGEACRAAEKELYREKLAS